jgi:hypothetical protein
MYLVHRRGRAHQEGNGQGASSEAAKLEARQQRLCGNADLADLAAVAGLYAADDWGGLPTR